MNLQFRGENWSYYISLTFVSDCQSIKKNIPKPTFFLINQIK